MLVPFCSRRMWCPCNVPCRSPGTILAWRSLKNRNLKPQGRPGDVKTNSRGCFLRDFERLVPCLGALGAQSVPGTPPFAPFQPILAPTWATHGSQNRAKINKKNHSKIDAKIDAFSEVLLQRCWLTLGVFLGPWTLEN